MITIKSKKEIDKMRGAGEIIALVLSRIEESVAPGITTLELDKIAEEIILKEAALPSFKGYRISSLVPPYPASICTSVNSEVVHGIPGETVLKNGDIISIDVGVCKDGMHADAARTYGVGEITEESLRLIKVAESSFFNGIRHASEGNRLGDVSYEIQRTVEENGFSVVRDMVGHGIGRELHEEPQIPNFGHRGKGVRLLAGMTLAIEPMINCGDYRVKTGDNRWTIVSVDGSSSAHYENTIVVTSEEPLILTII